jgi:hypothetical protein
MQTPRRDARPHASDLTIADDALADSYRAPQASDFAVALADGDVDADVDFAPIASAYAPGAAPTPPDWADALAAQDATASALRRTRAS